LCGRREWVADYDLEGLNQEDAGIGYYCATDGCAALLQYTFTAPKIEMFDTETDQQVDFETKEALLGRLVWQIAEEVKASPDWQLTIASIQERLGYAEV
jgi:hypothetical protein